MNPNYMKRVVEDYIYHRKNVRVNIKLSTPFDLFKLTEAYNYAIEWFERNKIN